MNEDVKGQNQYAYRWSTNPPSKKLVFKRIIVYFLNLRFAALLFCDTWVVKPFKLH